jgi:HSP20 family protein
MSGETSSEEKKEDESTFYSEWRSNRFCRQLTLPADVEADNVQATVKDGILQMSFKKKAETEVEKIAVKAA